MTADRRWSCCRRPRRRSPARAAVGPEGPDQDRAASRRSSGGAAQIGKDMTQRHRAVPRRDQPARSAGRKIELIVEDSRGQPDDRADQGAQARRAGPGPRARRAGSSPTSATRCALRRRRTRSPCSIRSSPPTISPSASPPSGWCGRAGRRASPSHPFGEWVAKTLELQEGRHHRHRLRLRLGGGRRLPADLRGERRADRPEALGAAQHHDFAPYLAQIKRDADAVFALFVSASALAFMKQYQDAGLKAKIPLIGGGTTTDEFVLPQMGDEALGGDHRAPLQRRPRHAREQEVRRRRSRPRPARSRPTTRRPATRARAGSSRPSRRSAATSRTARSSWPRCARSRSRTRRAGPVKLDEYGNPIQNIYVRKVEQVGRRAPEHRHLHLPGRVASSGSTSPRSF